MGIDGAALSALAAPTATSGAGKVQPATQSPTARRAPETRGQSRGSMERPGEPCGDRGKGPEEGEDHNLDADEGRHAEIDFLGLHFRGSDATQAADRTARGTHHEAALAPDRERNCEPHR